MCNKLYGSIVVGVALVLAILVNTVSIDTVDSVMGVMKFFETMIPVLVVGALVKYIFCGHKKKCCSKCGKDGCNCNKEGKCG